MLLLQAFAVCPSMVLHVLSKGLLLIRRAYHDSLTAHGTVIAHAVVELGHQVSLGIGVAG